MRASLLVKSKRESKTLVESLIIIVWADAVLELKFNVDNHCCIISLTQSRITIPDAVNDVELVSVERPTWIPAE